MCIRAVVHGPEPSFMVQSRRSWSSVRVMVVSACHGRQCVSGNHERVGHGAKDTPIQFLTALKFLQKCYKSVFSVSGYIALKVVPFWSMWSDYGHDE